MSDSKSDQHYFLADYEATIRSTDKLPPDNLAPVLQGLFGEVGSIMATSKKLHREGQAYTAYQDAAQEEFGDALWYLTALCRRSDIRLEEIIQGARSEMAGTEDILAAHTGAGGPIATVHGFKDIDQIDNVLLQLGQDAANLAQYRTASEIDAAKLIPFTATYLRAVQVTGLSFAAIIKKNVAKAKGRFLKNTTDELPTFDSDFPEDERIPDRFEVEIRQKADGKSHLRLNGVYVGSPLSDNIADRDGYRFHDVFHFANAAVLHWSPTFRALIKHKRKSSPRVDEAQDSGRAIVIEEGLSAYIFACAKDMKFFQGQSSVSFDLLKTIERFVRGYEVEACPASLWEDAILQGYEVFRKVLDNEGGVIVGDKTNRQITFRPTT